MALSVADVLFLPSPVREEVPHLADVEDVDVTETNVKALLHQLDPHVGNGHLESVVKTNTSDIEWRGKGWIS